MRLSSSMKHIVNTEKIGRRLVPIYGMTMIMMFKCCEPVNFFGTADLSCVSLSIVSQNHAILSFKVS